MRPHLAFALALHERLPAEGDLVWSPYSVASALGLAAAGARGRTRDELAALLSPGAELTELSGMLAASGSLPQAEMSVANQLWMDAGLRFREDYQRSVRDLPGGVLHTADLRGDPEGSRAKINDDVQRVTRGLIQELLAQGMITTETAAVIVNALYLKVAWLRAFPDSGTAPGTFHAPSGPRQVPMMHQRESFRYAAAGGWRMASLPTTAPVAVELLVPDDPGQPGGDLPPPTGEVLDALDRAARPVKLDLAVPRFRVRGAAVLNRPLRELGAVTAFSREADFSGITESESIYIDVVAHKAVLRVDEQGFEGAAATAAVMGLVSVDLSTPVPFHVDRPFLVLVRHVRTGAVYFLARVVEP